MEEFSNDHTVIHCMPVVLTVLTGLNARFDRLLNERHLITASVSDPMSISTIYIENSESPQKKRFLDGYKRRASTEIDEVEKYFAEETSDITVLHRFPDIREILGMSIIDISHRKK
ncbi:hypothetical protein OUZ56_005359 [Daphnia magna]|uniref:Uncharacterized protein n=1 Tax=Daphnia magna TaxID=35525 RepID=A0ABQ9YSK8_9CRUS|nr:hypothetical protein OUZ56_005359 [Daphnia magna]